MRLVRLRIKCTRDIAYIYVSPWQSSAFSYKLQEYMHVKCDPVWPSGRALGW